MVSFAELKQSVAEKTNPRIKIAGGVFGIDEYRKLLNDYKSSDEQITHRIEYLVAFCKNLARLELENYVKEIREQKNTTTPESL